jgi:hypothetical protein
MAEKRPDGAQPIKRPPPGPDKVHHTKPLTDQPPIHGKRVQESEIKGPGRPPREPPARKTS